MKELLKSLAAFQQEVPAIIKNTKGFGYKYANLAMIFETINPLMAKHGLGFYQRIVNDKLITTVFYQETGEKIESTIPFIANVELKGMNSFQVFGSQITYLRRYALACMLGLVTDEDQDATGKEEKKKSKQKITDVEGAYERARLALQKGDVTIEQIARKYDIEGVDFRLEELV